MFAITMANGWAAVPNATQQIELNVGWNLVSIQVGDAPYTSAAFQAALSDPSRLIEIWGYSPTGNPAVPGTWETFQPTQPAFPSDLTQLVQGRGYWVNVSQATTLTLTGVPWDGSVSLLAGWNLVGFPGLFQQADEAQEISGVFGSQFNRVQQVWTFDPDTQRFSGYDVTAIPALKELNTVAAGRGYWVYALEALLIQPGPYLALQQDADAAPLEPEVSFSAVDFPGLPNPDDYVGSLIRKVRPGSEDVPFDPNGNGIIDGPFTQDTIRFEVGLDRVVISLGNNGGGLVNWVLDNDIPWLFTAEANSKTYPSNVGRPQTANGVVSTDRDFVTLYVDRTGIDPGTETGSFTVFLGDQVRQIQVILEVPTSSGDWKGLATTRRVNGREISIGAVDLGLNLFMLSDDTAEPRFRAVLNKETSLLFPRDVFMNGVFFTGDQFSMTTSFGIDPGDRNAPPFDTFSMPANFSSLSQIDQIRSDFDANGDGVYDPSNPFPYPVRREITLLGKRLSPDRLEGSYIETITGMLPQNQAIFIEGTFFLDRESFEPTKRSIFNEVTDDPPLIIGGTSGLRRRETTLQVDDAVTISGIELGIDVTFPDPTQLTITLIGPAGQTVTVHQNGSNLPSNLDLAQFNGQIGAGIWTLRADWNATAERGYFNSWALNSQGLATYAVSGKVGGDLGAGNVPLEGVQLVLSGSNVIEETTTAADGSFAINGLTEDNYTLTLSRPGFASRIYPFFITNTDLYLGQAGAVEDTGSNDDPLVLAPVNVLTPELRAGPFIGQEPLVVNFNALIPIGDLAALGDIQSATWDFGDGSTVVDTAVPDDDVGRTTAKHTYTQAGHFTASLTLDGTLDDLTFPGVAIHVQRMTPDSTLVNGSPQTHQVFTAGLVGSFAAPVANGVGNIQLAPGSATTSQQVWIQQPGGSYTDTTITGVTTGIVWQESKRDTGGFDIDRPPFILDPANPGPTDFHLTAEDSDFVSRLYISGDGSLSLPFLSRPFNPAQDPASDNTPGTFFVYEPPEVNGQPIPDRFRCFVTLGGFVFNTQPSEVGDFVLQPGRVEP